MLNIKRFVVNMIRENCYVLSDDTRQALIVDCGACYPEESEALRQHISEQGLVPVALANTHGHFDHILGDGFVYQQYRLKPRLHPDDVELYLHLPEQTEAMLHRRIEASLPPVGQTYIEGDTLRFGHHTAEIIHTPGHTPGGVCLYLRDEGVLLSGDSLFRGSIGRTDFPGGNADALVDSLQAKVLSLPRQTIVLPGHGPQTTVGWEIDNNPFLQP